MTAISVTPPFPVFTGADGTPLEDGTIYIGEPNTNTVTNQIQVYWDKDLTIPAPQPIKTIAGYPSNNGTPSQLFVDRFYSIFVSDKNGQLVFSSPLAGNIESVSVLDFGAIGDGVADDSAAIQAAVDATNGSVYFPPGTYRLKTAITLKSDITLFGDGEPSVLLKDAAATGLTRDMIFRSVGTSTIQDVNFERLKFTTEQSSVSPSTQSMINFDGGNIYDITIRDCIFDNATSYANCAFFKSAAGYNVANVFFLNNRVNQCPRMAIEVINHDNGSNYNASFIVVQGNYISNCDFGVSLSGPVQNSIVSNNHFQNCSLYGVELVGVSGCVVDSNVFTGVFTNLISSSGSGVYPAGRGIVISNNTTNGSATGKVLLNNAGAATVSGNNFILSNRMEISGSFSDGCLITGNRIITGGNYAIICDNSPNHIIQGNVLDNSASAANFATVRAFNSGSTGIVLRENEITQGTGGVPYDESSGGSFNLVRGNIVNGSIEDNVLPKRTHKFNRRITASGTTVTATISLPPGPSWSNNVIKVGAAVTQDTGADAGFAYRVMGIRAVNSATAVMTTFADLVTSPNVVLTTSYGVSEVTVTATVVSGVRVTWDIQVDAYENGDCTVAYA
jgi:parallel beta-helix repeat protein